MPRTIDATLETALANGAYNAYFKAHFWFNGAITFTMENIVEYKLTGDSLTIKGVYKYGTDDYDQLSEVALERGIIINGITYGITTSKFKIKKAYFDGDFLNIEADLLGFEKFSRAGDVSWTTLLTDFFSNYGFSVTRKDTSESFWSNQVLPAGRIFTVNKGQQIKTFIKQKAFMGFADNGNQDVIIFAIKERPYEKTQEYSIDLEQILNITDNQIENTGFIGLLYRDESSVVHKPTAPLDTLPLYNIGFLKTGDVLMTASSGAGVTDTSNKIKILPQLIDSIDVAMNLTYQTGDHVRIKSEVTGIYKYGILLVTEYFDPKKKIPWGLTLSLWDYIGGTEGGTMPSTIEAAAPYTPLNVSNFNGILSANDNNIQTAMETIDEHTHSGSAPATTAINDFQVGDGSGNWITKTLAQVITILGIFADAASDSIYYVRRNATWTNLKTYTDTLYATLTHASRHQSGGADAIKLDDLATPDDNTDLDASTSKHGLLKKLSNVASEFISGTGTWTRLVSAVQGLYTHGNNASVPASTTYYLALYTPGLFTTLANIAVTRACTVQNLFFSTNSVQPASGSLVVTVLKNNVATSLTITIPASGAATIYSDTTHSVSFAQGDALTIKIVNNATAASALITRTSLELLF